jgi:hypothetical protein
LGSSDHLHHDVVAGCWGKVGENWVRWEVNVLEINFLPIVHGDLYLQQKISEKVKEFIQVRVHMTFHHESIDESVPFVHVLEFFLAFFQFYPVFYVLKNYDDVQDVGYSTLEHIDGLVFFSLFVFFLLLDYEIKGLFI